MPRYFQVHAKPAAWLVALKVPIPQACLCYGGHWMDTLTTETWPQEMPFPRNRGPSIDEAGQSKFRSKLK